LRGWRKRTLAPHRAAGETSAGVVGDAIGDSEAPNAVALIGALTAIGVGESGGVGLGKQALSGIGEESGPGEIAGLKCGRAGLEPVIEQHAALGIGGILERAEQTEAELRSVGVLELGIDPDLVDKDRGGDGRATKDAVEGEELFGAGGIGDLLVGTEHDGTRGGSACLWLSGGLEIFAS